MSTEKLDQFLAAADDFDASDLHLVAGVPPAFRVNGEIIIAEEDALAEQDITLIADSLLNEPQKKKFFLWPGMSKKSMILLQSNFHGTMDQ